jgi:hypothetical protein
LKFGIIPYLSSSSFQFQYFMEGAEGYFDLILGRLARGHPLEPEARFDEVLHALCLSLLIRESDDFVGESCDQRDEDHSRGHLVSEWKLVGDEGENHYAHHHHDEKKAGSASGMKMTVAFDPIGHQLISGLKGEDRLVFGPVILKDSPDLFKKRDGPEIS